MNLLVVGSCTGEKESCGCAYPLTEEDFADTSRFLHREGELAPWGLPAARLYTGWQHRYMAKGIDELRQRFGVSCCTLKIISAGYGLVDENRTLVPYEATFQGKPQKWVRERADRLKIPHAIREAVRGFEAVVFLLGKEYLLSTDPPLVPDRNQWFVFFTSNRHLQFHPDSTVVPAGKNETRFGAGIVALKGKMFELLAYGLCANPGMWTRLLSDKTSASVLTLIELGRSSQRNSITI